MTWSSDEEGDDVGIHFTPTDEEVIKDYLIPESAHKFLTGGEYITYKDIYAKEPWLLNHNNKDDFFEKNEWYYFSRRTRVSNSKSETSFAKYTKRKIIGGGNGYWKPNRQDEINDTKTGNPIGRKNSLTFIKGKNKNNNNTTSVSGSDSNWIMEEYLIGGKTTTTFQELVMCKIKEKKNKSKKEEDDASGGLLEAEDGNDSYLDIQEEEEDDGSWMQDLELDLSMKTSNDQAFDYNSSANI